MVSYNGAFEALRVHRVSNLWINQQPLETPIQPAILLCWEYCFSKANHSSIGKILNYVNIRRCEEITVRSHQILMNNSGNKLQKLQFKRNVNSKEVTL